MTKSQRAERADFPYLDFVSTRWADNDIYGHVNNVNYYAFFDTAVNHFLLVNGVLRPHNGAVIGLVVESGCRYHEPIAFPDRIAVGVRVHGIGKSSVRYELGIFRNDAAVAAAEGHFVHVHVDRESRRPVRVPDAMRRALALAASAD